MYRSPLLSDWKGSPIPLIFATDSGQSYCSGLPNVREGLYIVGVFLLDLMEATAPAFKTSPEVAHAVAKLLPVVALGLHFSLFYS